MVLQAPVAIFTVFKHPWLVIGFMFQALVAFKAQWLVPFFWEALVAVKPQWLLVKPLLPSSPSGFQGFASPA